MRGHQNKDHLKLFGRLEDELVTKSYQLENIKSKLQSLKKELNDEKLLNHELSLKNQDASAEKDRLLERVTQLKTIVKELE